MAFVIGRFVSPRARPCGYTQHSTRKLLIDGSLLVMSESSLGTLVVDLRTVNPLQREAGDGAAIRPREFDPPPGHQIPFFFPAYLALLFLVHVIFIATGF